MTYVCVWWDVKPYSTQIIVFVENGVEIPHCYPTASKNIYPRN